MRGALEEMVLMGIILLNCRDRSRACLRVRNLGRGKGLYFREGDTVADSLTFLDLLEEQACIPEIRSQMRRSSITASP